MKVNFYLCGDESRDDVTRALYVGCPEEKKLVSVMNYQPSDVAVVFGVRKKALRFSEHRGVVLDSQKAAERPTIILETGYIKRGEGSENYYAAGIDGLNGRANFKVDKATGDRWEALGAKLAPWRRNGKYILLCGQVPWDAAVDFTNHVDWLKNAVAQIKARTERPIVFKPHPKGPFFQLEGCETTIHNIERALENAWAAVSFNSNTGVDALLHGVPVFAADAGSMVWAVANTDLSKIDEPLTPDRTRWSHEIAYTQWTPAEMRQGLTWNHLFG